MSPRLCGSKIEVLNPFTTPDWDSIVAALPGYTLFHSSAWARVLHDAYGYTPTYLLLRAPGAPPAALPLMDIRSWLTGRRGVSLPFTDEVAPLAPDATTFSALLEAARTRGLHSGWKTLELRGAQSWLAALPHHQPSTSYWTHRLELNSAHPPPASGLQPPPSDLRPLASGLRPPASVLRPPPSALPPPASGLRPPASGLRPPASDLPSNNPILDRFSPSHRRAIRKAESSGLEVEFATSLEALRHFYALLCLTRRRHGAPPQPWPFFAALHRHLLASARGVIVLARHQGRPIAGAVYLHSGPLVHYKYGASDESYQQLRANNLVMSRAIQWHAERGFASLDFGRTSLTNDGLRRFKLGWGTQESRLDYTKLDLATGTFLAAPDRTSGWHTRVFQRLPLPLSRLAGRLLYPHLA